MMEMDEMKGKGKRGLLRVVFGRTVFFLLFIALQLAVLYWVYVWAGQAIPGMGIWFLCCDQRDPHDPYPE